MYALVVTIHIKPEHREEFIKAMLDNARASVQNEPDCLLFDVVQDETDPNFIYLYEVYWDAKAFEYHTQTPHFIHFFDITKDWTIEPIVIGKGTHLYPPDDRWLKQL
jgi:(4S)-4-hydroxy-5-phosphonooxypentane-2,3-dione isomerase